jgi:hypothetical protein
VTPHRRCGRRRPGRSWPRPRRWGWLPSWGGQQPLMPSRAADQVGLDHLVADGPVRSECAFDHSIPGLGGWVDSPQLLALLALTAQTRRQSGPRSNRRALRCRPSGLGPSVTTPNLAPPAAPLAPPRTPTAAPRVAPFRCRVTSVVLSPRVVGRSRPRSGSPARRCPHRQIGALLTVADVERGGLGRAAGRGLVAEEDVVTAAGQQDVVAQVADQAVVAAAAADGRRRRRARG